ncbi:MAG: hypothetical protein LLF82_001330 [Dehalococcoides mccartyi]|jgi:hypothetical protein|uniref:Cardiolipin synthase N-terminal domain-containing protein n=3 Tax=root TaxID=1 RepID=A0A0V8M2T1_9CHLR|nr:conserved domain protein [Dehalococcoides mccartyi 195]AII59788.1 hypothetical protein X793_05630 [Dehalococcoides mccartyi CG4]AQU03472.1 hypothetical protein B1773_05495 [Dehalococcoides mccartyi]AQU04771.1 hypothetical protein B1774_05145 [Dehalococcoides mccartyi]KSV18107.1 hypothetical protein DA01_05560 [Dehalococcoides mccartyi]
MPVFGWHEIWSILLSPPIFLWLVMSVLFTILVVRDAKKRGYQMSSYLFWGIFTFLLPPLGSIAYLILRK